MRFKHATAMLFHDQQAQSARSNRGGDSKGNRVLQEA